MAKPLIVVHYHEIWLKGGNRRFFLSKLHAALKQALGGLPVERILKPGDRMLIEFGEGANVDEAVARIERVFGVAFYAVARRIPRETTQSKEDALAALSEAAWEEVRGEKFSSFAVRAKRSDKSFPATSMEIDFAVGRALLEKLRGEGRNVSVNLRAPELTCRIEIPPGPSLLVYAKENSRRGRIAAQYHRTHGVPALRRIRFRRGCVQNDEARRAPELRAFLGRRRETRRIFGARGARVDATAGAVAICRKTLSGAV